MQDDRYNEDGTVAPLGFKCGLVDDSFGYGVRIEGCAEGFLARADGGYSVLYRGPSLKGAHAASRKYAKRSAKYSQGDYEVDSSGIGEGYVARVLYQGTVIATGETTNEAMINAENFEGDN